MSQYSAIFIEIVLRLAQSIDPKAQALVSDELDSPQCLINGGELV
jgi:hypothetical protein